MERAQAGVSAELIQIQPIAAVAVTADIVAKPTNPGGDGVNTNVRQGTAPPAGAQAGAFRFCRDLVEAHILAQRPAAGARRTTVDARRDHSKDELPVLAFVLVDHGFPTPFVIQHLFRFPSFVHLAS